MHYFDSHFDHYFEKMRNIVSKLLEGNVGNVQCFTPVSLRSKKLNQRVKLQYGNRDL